MIAYCGSCGSIPARSSAARIAIAPSSVARIAGEPAAELPERRPHRADDDAAAATRATLADEALLAGEPAREGGDEADRGLEVVERRTSSLGECM